MYSHDIIPKTLVTVSRLITQKHLIILYWTLALLEKGLHGARFRIWGFIMENQNGKEKGT